MQNRYFGDVGDFGKYGILRSLCGLTSSGPSYSLGIVWYLVPDEGHNSDGKHTSYLQKPSEYRNCDPNLFDGLRVALTNGKRAVSEIHNSSLLPKETRYFDTLLTYENIPIRGLENKNKRLFARKNWITNAIKVVGLQDIIFLDPDNGIEIKSVSKYEDKAIKYVFWDEVEKFSSLEKTLVIYHHLNRTMKSYEQIKIKYKELMNNLSRDTNVIPILFKRGSHRVFFVLPSLKDRIHIEERIEKIQLSDWSPHLKVLRF